MSKKVNFYNILIPLLLSAVGTIFLIYYIFRASTDVVTSDYIRIINSYLDGSDVSRYLLSWESVTRIPFTFLARFINIKYFNYSVYFDKVLGLLGLFIFNFVLVRYILKKYNLKFLKIILSIIITFISFSLMSWEMILNGTGYPHFITMGLIAVTYNLNQKRAILVSIFIAIITIIFAGNYAVSFLATIILVKGYEAIRLMFVSKMEGSQAGSALQSNNSLSHMLFIILLPLFIAIICFLIYFKSSITGETLTPVGFHDITFIDLLKYDILFPVKFIVCSFASALIGVETLMQAMTTGTISINMIYVFGIIYILITIWAVIIITKKLLLKKVDLLDNDAVNLPLSFIICGLLNFVLVFLARYKFIRVDYGMSSRYAIQYMFLTIGIILVVSKHIEEIIVEKKAVKKKEVEKKVVALMLSSLCIFILSFGHLITFEDEIFKSEYRKFIYTYVENVAKNYRNFSDDELTQAFEYRRDPEHIKSALKILEDQKLNVFKEN